MCYTKVIQDRRNGYQSTTLCDFPSVDNSTLSRNSDSFRDNAMQRSEIGVFLPRDAMHDGLRQKICIYTTLCD